MGIDKITLFKDDYYFLNNSYPVPLAFGKAIYPTVEHAYQATKTRDGKLMRKIIKCRDGNRARRMGNNIEPHEDWVKNKIKIMHDLLVHKFTSHFDLRDRLLNTGDVVLINDNSYGDIFWGVCKGKGLNTLGKLLMNIRGSFKQKLVDDSIKK